MGIRYCRIPTLDRQLSTLSAGLTASVLLFLVYGVVANEIYNRFLYWPFGLLVAIAFISRQSAPVHSTESETTTLPARQGAGDLPPTRGSAGREGGLKQIGPSSVMPGR